MALSRTVAHETLVKRPNEELVYTMTFSKLLATGETIDEILSITCDPASGLTFQDEGDADSDDAHVQFQVAGGLDGESYTFICSVLTTLGNTRELAGVLEISTD